MAVIFTFNQAGFGPGLLQPNGGPSVGPMGINAMLTHTGTATGPVVGNAQTYTISSFSIRRTSDNANLLSVFGNPAALHVGVLGGTTADLTSSKPPVTANISYTSDFVSFPTATTASIVFGFTQPAPVLITVTGANFGGPGGTDLLLNPSGNFPYTSSEHGGQGVPEPAR